LTGFNSLGVLFFIKWFTEESNILNCFVLDPNFLLSDGRLASEFDGGILRAVNF